MKRYSVGRPANFPKKEEPRNLGPRPEQYKVNDLIIPDISAYYHHGNPPT